MRFPDDFASLDLRQQALATRMLHHEARTSTIAAWTGLGADRIRGLAARLSPEQRARALHRVRGHAPTQFHSFLRPHARHREAAALAALLQEVGALGPDLERPASAFVPFESLERGEKLCQAYERYRGADTQGAIPFDYAVLLLTTLAHTRELALALCANCREPWLLDVYGAPDQHCPRCSPRSQLVSLVYGSRAPHETTPTTPYQLPLFDFLPAPPPPPEPAPTLAPNPRLAAAVAARRAEVSPNGPGTAGTLRPANAAMEALSRSSSQPEEED